MLKPPTYNIADVSWKSTAAWRSLPPFFLLLSELNFGFFFLFLFFFFAVNCSENSPPSRTAQALTAVAALSCDPLVLMGVGVSLIVYGVGIHGAQKRKHRALFFYGATTLMSLVLSVIAVACIAGFLLLGGSMRHSFQPHHKAGPHGMLSDMGEHAHSRTLDLMHMTGMTKLVKLQPPQQPRTLEINPAGFKKALEIKELEFPGRVAAAKPSDDESSIPIISGDAKDDVKPIDASVPIVDVKPPVQDPAEQPEEIDASVPVVRGPKQEPKEIDASVPVVHKHGPKRPHGPHGPHKKPSSSDADSSSMSDGPVHDGPVDGENYSIDVEYRVTPFGYAVLALGVVIGLVILVLKIKSIRLAFQMRRMLLAMQNTSLPVRQPTAPATVQLATPPAGVQPPSGPAPTVRRDCSRCTYVNAVSATRCAMCDSPLAIVANAAPAPVPRIFVPGSLYPLNAPLN